MSKKQKSPKNTEAQKLKQRISILEEENQALIEIISILPGHIYWKNRKGELLGCNNKQAFAAGLKSPQKIVGLKPIDLIKKAQPESERIKQAKAIEKIDQKVMRENVALSVEETAILKDGSKGYFISNKTPLHDKKGKVKGLSGVTLNITELKNLESTNKNKSKFIINIGSLVRDALSSVVGTADILSQTNLSNKQKRCADLILQGSTKLTPLLDRLNDYVDLEDNNLCAIENAFNLKAFFKTLLEEYIPLTKKKLLKINFNYDNTLPNWAEGGEYFFSQAMNILLNNLIKTIKQNQIKIAVRKTSQIIKGNFKLEIKIEAPECKMSEAALNNLFGLFDDSSDDNNHFVRANLDLSIAAKMLSLIGATIKVKSKTNKGIVFTIKLQLKKSKPLKKSNDKLLSMYYQNDENSEIIKPVESLIHVLIFDNDPLWQQALKLMLEEAYMSIITPMEPPVIT